MPSPHAHSASHRTTRRVQCPAGPIAIGHRGSRSLAPSPSHLAHARESPPLERHRRRRRRTRMMHALRAVTTHQLGRPAPPPRATHTDTASLAKRTRTRTGMHARADARGAGRGSIRARRLVVVFLRHTTFPSPYRLASRPHARALR